VNPNVIEIKRVFVREFDALGMDDTLPWAGGGAVGQENRVIVEWEAGATANADPAANINFTVAIYDHTTGAPLAPALTVGPLAPPNVANENRTYQQEFNLPALTVGNMYEVTACLTRGTNIVSFHQGPLFTAY
jgi:hypothetical protein